MHWWYIAMHWWYMSLAMHSWHMSPVLQSIVKSLQSIVKSVQFSQIQFFFCHKKGRMCTPHPKIDYPAETPSDCWTTYLGLGGGRSKSERVVYPQALRNKVLKSACSMRASKDSHMNIMRIKTASFLCHVCKLSGLRTSQPFMYRSNSSSRQNNPYSTHSKTPHSSYSTLRSVPNCFKHPAGPGESWSTVGSYEWWKYDYNFFENSVPGPSLNLFFLNLSTNLKAGAIEAPKRDLKH